MYEEYYPVVVQALAGDGFTVYVYFSDGSIRCVDVKPLIAQRGVFARLADPNVFQDCLTVMNQTVAWDVVGTRDPCACVDFDPIGIYENAPAVADPLGDVA